MNKNSWRMVVGGILIVLGLLALLNAMPGINLGGLVWAAVFILAGLVFIYVLVSDRRQWWASFPGFPLLGIGILIAVEELAPRAAALFGGALVVGAIAVSFLVVYFLNRTFWWALIPAGTMLSITVMILLEPFVQDPVWAFFLGLGATFGVLALLPLGEGKRMTWPLIPAVVLFAMGIIFMIGSIQWSGYIWPAILILVGLYFVFRAVRQKA